MSDKQTENSVKVANITKDFVIQLGVLFLQVAALILVACMIKDRSWTFGVIVGMLSLSALFFGTTFVYRLYRARLTFVDIDKTSVTFRIRFGRRTIPAEDIAVSLVETDKPDKTRKFGYVFDKNNESDGFIFAVHEKKTLEKLKDFAPHALLVFVVMCTDDETLKKTDVGADGDLAELIKTELACREQARAEANRKNKRNKRR